ncbi:HSP90 family protein [Flexithrix dorotheae]|uniref:HSP90 family protein n=1 Tax=Flexithrix dorotheae TaxID=70993 RepID=UPI000361602D|nr:HSP90 family protein [Flexithrix dorotheae]
MHKFNFQVNLEGIIDILSNHLYSEERVFIRELLQNATDAISARKRLDPAVEGEISLEIIEKDNENPAQLIVEDNGIGLTEQEVHEFLSNIGSSSKRDELSLKRQDFIGQFGIGLLSCFMVTHEIVMITKSYKGGRAIEWIGNSDGSYSIKQLERDFEPGTKIYLKAKPGKNLLFVPSKIQEIVRYYGDLLPYPVYLLNPYGKEIINEGIAPWEKYFDTKSEERVEFMDFGKKHFDLNFIDYIPIKTNYGEAEGVAYILPYETNPSAKKTNKVFLKNMLVSEKVDNILPDWAFFVKCIINVQNLRPTASREGFYEDENLFQTKNEIGEIFKAYFLELEKTNPEKLKKLYVIHYHSMNALALHDDEFFKIIINYIPFETASGHLTIPEFERHSGIIRHIPDVDEFKQIAGVAHAQGIPIINSGYTYKRELLEKLEKVFPEKKVNQVSTEQFIEQFENLNEDELNQVDAFFKIAEETLWEFKCVPIIKKFDPVNIPTLYSKDEFMGFLKSANKSKDVSNNLWGGIINSITNEEFAMANASLCFNYNSPLIRKMVSVGDEDKLALFIKVIYVQALMLGHHPLQANEMKILSEGLVDLIDLSLH